MDKRYQVFVSSTFLDLQEERQEVMFTLMKMDCFPAGMELFPTADEQQWDYIKKAIDQSDYYVIIVGARYGSLATGESISYTEKEFDYAVESGKTVLVLLHRDPESLPINKADNDESKREALEKFRIKLQTGRLVDYWNSAADLGGKVALGLIQAIKTRPAKGWTRGGDQAEQSEEISNLLKDNIRLRNKLDELKQSGDLNSSSAENSLLGLDDPIQLDFMSRTHTSPSSILADLGQSSFPKGPVQSRVIPLAEVFKMLGRLVEGNNNYQNLRDSLSASLIRMLNMENSLSLTKETYDQIILQFRALGLVFLENETLGANSPSIFLSKRGEQRLLQELALKK